MATTVRLSLGLNQRYVIGGNYMNVPEKESFPGADDLMGCIDSTELIAANFIRVANARGAAW
jgi:hypothetical protein